MDPKPVLDPAATAEIPCFLCNGAGHLSRERLLKDLGIRHLADLAKIGVKETIDELNRNGFKFLQEVREELEKTFQDRVQAERERLHRDNSVLVTQFRQATEQKERLEADKRQLEAELQRARATSSKKGEQGEVEFVEFVQPYKHFRVGPKLPKNGDYQLSIQVEGKDGVVRWFDEVALIDVKKDLPITAAEVTKLVRDALIRKSATAFLVAHSSDQLRGKDPLSRVQEQEGVVVVTVAMQDFPLYVDLMRPYLQRIAQQKPDEEEGAWETKWRGLSQQVALSLNDLAGILDFTRKVRSEAEGIDKIVEKIRKRLAELCGTA